MKFASSQVEQLVKSKDYMKNKLEECELKEMDLIGQINKFTDLVKLLEMEKNQVAIECVNKLTFICLITFSIGIVRNGEGSIQGSENISRKTSRGNYTRIH
jgi:hypothetical protein